MIQRSLGHGLAPWLTRIQVHPFARMKPTNPNSTHTPQIPLPLPPLQHPPQQSHRLLPFPPLLLPDLVPPPILPRVQHLLDKLDPLGLAMLIEPPDILRLGPAMDLVREGEDGAREDVVQEDESRDVVRVGGGGQLGVVEEEEGAESWGGR